MLVALATLAARRWGAQIGGVVSAFPAIVGPVLLIGALDHGGRFAAEAANATLLGLAALGAFAVAYGRLARHWRWRGCFAAAWGASAVTAATVAAVVPDLGAPTGIGVAALSLLLAYRLMPAAGTVSVDDRAPRGDLPARMAATALLVSALAAAADRLGPLLGGMLTALPVLASVLAVFTHRQQGADSVVGLLRGMVAGMAGFVAFCEVVALLIGSAGPWPTFAAATAAAVAVQAATGRTARSPVSAR